MTPAQAGHAAMLAFSGLVAGSFALGGLAAPHMDPAALNAVRFVLAAVILGVGLRVSGVPMRAAAAAPWRYVVLAILFVGYFVLMFEGLKTGAPVSMAAVFTLTPPMAAGFGFLLLRQRTTGRMALALALGGGGALWVIFDASLPALLGWQLGRGEAIYFWGCVAHAVYAPLVRKFSRGEGALVFTFYILCAGAALLLIFGARALMQVDWAALPGIVWLTIGYTAIAATICSTALLGFAAQRLPSAKVMAYTYLIPSWVMVWSAALGQGWAPLAVLPGVGVTVLAVVLLLKQDSAV